MVHISSEKLFTTKRLVKDKIWVAVYVTVVPTFKVGRTGQSSQMIAAEHSQAFTSRQIEMFRLVKWVV